MWPLPDIAPLGVAVWMALIGGGAAAICLAALPPPQRLRLRAWRRRHSETTAAVRAAHLWLRRRHAELRGRSRERWHADTIELCRVLAAESRGGRPPPDALAAAVGELTPETRAELADAVAAARSGHDPGPALRRVAHRPGAAGLAHLAACWRVAADTGGGLAESVDRLAYGLTEDQAHRHELNAQLAGPRTTAILLALLPLLGLLMARGLGLSPWSFLVTTPGGLLCLVSGLALDLAGLVWIARMTRRARDTVEPPVTAPEEHRRR